MVSSLKLQLETPSTQKNEGSEYSTEKRRLNRISSAVSQNSGALSVS